MVTNCNKWAFFFLLLAFVMVSIFGAGNGVASFYSGDTFSRLELWRNAGRHTVFSGYYQDQNHERSSIRAHIPSDIITGDVLRLFVVANIQREDHMLKNMSLDSLQEVYPDTSKVVLRRMVVQSYYQVYLDEQPVEHVDWFFHYNTQTKQRGYLAYLNISPLNEGQHWVDVRGPNADAEHSFVEIPFYRDLVQPVSKSKITKQTDEETPDFQPKPFGVRE